MDAAEVVEYLNAHPQQFRDQLRNYGVRPEAYADLPAILTDYDRPLDAASAEAVTTAAKALDLLSSSGPLWTPPSDDSTDDNHRPP